MYIKILDYHCEDTGKVATRRLGMEDIAGVIIPATYSKRIVVQGR